MVQIRDAQLVPAEEITLGQALYSLIWHCLTAPGRGDQSQHGAGEVQPPGAWSRPGGRKGTSSGKRMAKGGQVRALMQC